MNTESSESTRSGSSSGLERALREEIAMLREANVSAARMEQINRNEANRLRDRVAVLTEALKHYKNHPPPHPPASEDEQRDRFEKWISLPPTEREIDRWPNDYRHAWPGQYRDIYVQLAWEAWLEAMSNQSI